MAIFVVLFIAFSFMVTLSVLDAAVYGERYPLEIGDTIVNILIILLK